MEDRVKEVCVGCEYMELEDRPDVKADLSSPDAVLLLHLHSALQSLSHFATMSVVS